MEILTFAFLLLIGLCSGFAVSAGVFALITALSLIPRMADKTHTGAYVKSYETSVLTGGLSGMALYFFDINDRHLSLYQFLQNIAGHDSIIITALFLWLPLVFAGLFIGIFVGTLAISLAENLDVTAVFGRRVRLHGGMGFIILSFALGKILGAFLFFFNRWF